MQDIPVSAVNRLSPIKPPMLTTNQVGAIMARIAYACGVAGVSSNVDVVMLQDYIIEMQDTLHSTCTERDDARSRVAELTALVTELKGRIESAR